MELRSCARAGFKKFAAVHTWIIQDFSLYPHDESLESDSFVTRYRSYEWKLTLYPGRCDEVHVSLTLLSSLFYDAVIAKAKLWIVDDKKLERNILTLDVARFENKTCREFGPIVSRKDLFDVSNRLLPDDTLTLCCEVTELVRSVDEGPEIPPPPSLEQDFGRLLKKQSFCDVTLIVGEKEFQVHKAVLVARSPVFRAMFQHQTEEASGRRVVVIKDLSPEVVKRVLRYVYTNVAEDPGTEIEGLLDAATKYDLEGLRSLCKEWIWRRISTETAVDMFRLADKHGLADLKAGIESYIEKKADDVFGTEGWKKALQEDPGLVESIFCSHCEHVKVNTTGLFADLGLSLRE